MIKVKPLEWVEAKVSDKWERFEANTILGKYEVLEWSNGEFGGSVPKMRPYGDALEFTVATMEKAKEVAQADFEYRILSVIEPEYTTHFEPGEFGEGATVRRAPEHG